MPGTQDDHRMAKLIGIKSRTEYHFSCVHNKGFPGIVIMKSGIKVIVGDADVEYG